MLTDILSSVLSGGLTGMVGAAITRYADYKTKQLDIEVSKMKFENELALRHVDERIMEKEWEGRNKVAITEAESASDASASVSFNTSLTSEPKTYSNTALMTTNQNWMMLVLDFVRGIIRPGLTIYLCVLTTVLYFKVSAPLEAKESADIQFEIIRTILYLSTCVILWWFGIRSKGQSKK